METHGGKCYLKNRTGQVVGEGHMVNRLYLLEARADLHSNEKAFITGVQEYSWDEWHKWYGHLSMSALKCARREHMVTGLNIDESTIPSRSCETCLKGKMAHHPFLQEALHHSTDTSEHTMTDIWGPAPVQSINKYQYFIMFMDDAMRMCHTLSLKSKDKAFDQITSYFNLMQTQYRKLPKKLCMDNGKELMNAKLKEWVSGKGMILEPMAP